ncbi:hypothetical protein [Marispirochaeta aestuarii]|uniref:hypothetical protein n=1 Tax=Marispirochaeta aestuarii TaxID=1963862 RepID=UPI0029C80219|nr:hypothetical protein [Marispirochaeta aestuarii]
MHLKAVSGGVLTLRSEKKGKREKKRDYYHRKSWRGEFFRKVVLLEETGPRKR